MKKGAILTIVLISLLALAVVSVIGYYGYTKLVKKEVVNVPCRDTDNGRNFDIKGKACMGDICETDYCVDNKTLREYSLSGIIGEDFLCKKTNSLVYEDYTCLDECEDGACLGPEIPVENATDTYENQTEGNAQPSVKIFKNIHKNQTQNVSEGICEYITLPLPQIIPKNCINNDYYCPWECNDWRLDNDCGVPQIYDYIESRTPNEYLNSSMIHWDDTSWRSYQPLIQKVNELTNGISDNFEKAKKIADWVKHSKSYTSTISPANRGESIISIFNSNNGVCLDAAILTAAMFRIANISSRVLTPSVGIAHAYTEGYINDRWIGFDATFGGGDVLVFDPVTSVTIDHEFYKNEPKYVVIFSDGTPYNLTNISYYKPNFIPRTIFKDSTHANISIIWGLNNVQKQIKEKHCELSSYKTGESDRFDISPISKEIYLNDEYVLTCEIIFASEPYTVYNEIMSIAFKGIKVETIKLISDGYVNISIKTNDINSASLGWGYVNIPLISINVFINKGNTYSLTYDPQNYDDWTNIRGVIKSNNLNCDYYHCNYVFSNNYSMQIIPGIVGYGNFPDLNNAWGMPPEHNNGFSRISLPEGEYKLVYQSMNGTVFGYKAFTIVPNQSYTICPNQIIKDETASEKNFDILKQALSISTSGLLTTH